MQDKFKVNLDYVRSKQIINETEEYMSEKHLVKKELGIKKVENGIILPYRPSYGNKNLPNFGEGGVLNSNLNFVQESFYDGNFMKHGGAYKFSQRDLESNSKDVIYIGSIGKHYGHFLIDQVSRLYIYIYNEGKFLEDKYIAYIGQEKLSGNFLEFLTLLGISEDKLIYVDKPTQFKNIYIPEQSTKTCKWYTEQYKEIFTTVAKNAMKSNKDFKPIDKIYFTRSNFLVAQQKEVGENIYEEIFKNNGYKVLVPENISLTEMIKYINTAKSIACINGTIPLNIIFALKPVELIVLNKTEIFHKNLMYFLDIVKNDVTYIDIYSDKHKGTNIGVGPFLMDYTKSMKQFCKDNNFNVPKQIFKFQYKNKIKFFYLTIRRKVRDILHPIRQKMKKLLGK